MQNIFIFQWIVFVWRRLNAKHLHNSLIFFVLIAKHRYIMRQLDHRTGWVDVTYQYLENYCSILLPQSWSFIVIFNIIRIKNTSNIVIDCIPLDNQGFTLNNVHFIISSIYSSINIKDKTILKNKMTFHFFVGDTTTMIYMGATKTFIGEGNPTKCLTIINSFLKSAADDMCYPKPCAIGRTYQPSIGTDNFYAIAAFTYAPRSLGTVDSSGKLNMSRLNDTAFDYCQKVRSSNHCYVFSLLLKVCIVLGRYLR